MSHVKTGRRVQVSDPRSRSERRLRDSLLSETRFRETREVREVDTLPPYPSPTSLQCQGESDVVSEILSPG